jgi:hypothetical protein
MEELHAAGQGNKAFMTLIMTFHDMTSGFMTPPFPRVIWACKPIGVWDGAENARACVCQELVLCRRHSRPVHGAQRHVPQLYGACVLQCVLARCTTWCPVIGPAGL